ncbi:MAG TPA: iron-containing alcohol dehydrogenase [Candidatus Gemmiger excrementipullorum]|uniref:Iron-containing alcohol dehydrogenase n=1 Tax=Candidatus Gemmiger excrementipullorum TaxID=2838610 RepID=A0A9D1Y0Y3_9FIRM|nr:iron-containing alcohol dehydrogenase [Candidatus Gemmiger excrementipullorum]
MNVLKKVFCRVFQAGMRIALPFLPYREPELIRGVGGVPAVLRTHDIDCVMLVTDAGVRGLGLTAHLEELLKAAHIRCVVYDGTVANPTVANVEQARMLYLENGCQGLIAFGGGSSMDCAKALGARIVRPNKPLARMEGLLQVLRRLPLLIAVPTTAGTGSETTLAAVITDEKIHHKYPINDFALIPHYAVLDPDVTLGLPPHLTATTGMDALTHAVEAYIGRSTTKGTRAAAIEAVQLIFANLPEAYFNGHDRDARANMLRAAYLAGTAFTKSYVGYVHAVAHSLGGRYGIAHGLANSVLLPVVLKAYGPAAWKKLAELARAVGVSSAARDEEAAKAFIEAIEAMNAAMDIPETLPGILSEDIPQLARYADHEANPLYPVPVLWGPEELQKMYELVQEAPGHDAKRDRDHTDTAA